MAYFYNNRFAVSAGAVSGTVQTYLFTLPTANTPVSANAVQYPSFLVSVGTTGATGTDTAALILADGYAMPLVSASTMTAVTVSRIIAGTVLMIVPKVINGVLTGVVVNL